MRQAEESKIVIESYDGTALDCIVQIDHVIGRVDMFILHEDKKPEHHFFGGDNDDLITQHEAEQYLYRVLT